MKHHIGCTWLTQYCKNTKKEKKIKKKKTNENSQMSVARSEKLV